MHGDSCCPVYQSQGNPSVARIGSRNDAATGFPRLRRGSSEVIDIRLVCVLKAEFRHPEA